MNTKLILLDDDVIFSQTLKRQFERCQYQVEIVHQAGELLKLADTFKPDLIILDLNLGSESSLHLIAPLKAQFPNSVIIMLTGYGSIATCVNAMKAGADDYLTKPLSFAVLLDKVESLSEKVNQPALNEFHDDIPQMQITTPMSATQLEWEHIQAVLNANDGNVSQTARQLNMHRRTLQRKLNKKAPGII